MNISAIVLISLAAIIVLGIGAGISFYVGRKNDTEEAWIVGGRKLPTYVLAFTQYATAVGGGILVAHVGIAYAWGFSVFWYDLFVIIGMLIIALFANWLRKHRFSTLPEIFTRLYGEHRPMMTLVAVAVILVPFGWIATQFVAFASLFSKVTGIAVTPLIIVMALFSVLLVLPGGLTSVAWSDFFFGVFMFAASIIVASYAIVQAGGWGTVMSSIPDSLSSMPTGFTAAGGTTILLWLFAILPGTLANQLYYQRIFAASSGKDARRGIYLSSAMVVVSGVYALMIGLAVRSMNPTLGEDDRELAAGWFLTQLPSWVLAVFGAFLVATIVSTTGSALQSVVANMINDLRAAYVRTASPPNQRVKLSRWCTVGVTAVATLMAIVYPEALDWLVATYSYSAAIIVVPLLIGIVVSRRYTIHAAVGYTSMIAGLVGCGVAHIVDTTIPYSVYGIVVSLIGYGAAVLVKRPTPAGRQEEVSVT